MAAVTKAGGPALIDGTFLKITAMASMLTDHIGAAFFPQYTILRIIGRLAFPIYAFLIAEGCVYSSSRMRYLGRLFALALLSELPFDLALFPDGGRLSHQNVCFTLFIGLAMVTAVRFREDKEHDTGGRPGGNGGAPASVLDSLMGRDSHFERFRSVTAHYAFGMSETAFCVLVFLAGGLAARLLGTDYSWYGTSMIFFFYLFRDRPWLRLVSAAVIILIMGGLEDFALLALPLIAVYNGRIRLRTRAWRIFEYAFYPVHLLIIGLINLYLI